MIIPTLNRSDYLLITLKHLLKQTFDLPYEIIVIDQSDKIDLEIVELGQSNNIVQYHHIRHFRGLPEARNYGWKSAQYDYILYLDDDITCSESLLEEHYKQISLPHVGIVGGGITEVMNPNSGTKTGVFNFWKAQPISGFHNEGLFEVDHVKGCNFSIKKSVMSLVHGTDERFTKGSALYEETDLCLRVKRLGFPIIFNSCAHVYHHSAPTGGCRVLDTNKYIFSLVRNRSIVIERHLEWYHKITAHLVLIRLVLSYVIHYKNLNLIYSYLLGFKEGTSLGRKNVLVSTQGNNESSI